MATVTFDHVTKKYAEDVTAVDDLHLEIEDGEFLVLVGPSGCGKTTALRCVAGLEDITFGRLLIGERVVNHVPSKDRNIAMVFQSYGALPAHDGVRQPRLRPEADEDRQARDQATRPGSRARARPGEAARPQ